MRSVLGQMGVLWWYSLLRAPGKWCCLAVSDQWPSRWSPLCPCLASSLASTILPLNQSRGRNKQAFYCVSASASIRAQLRKIIIIPQKNKHSYMSYAQLIDSLLFYYSNCNCIALFLAQQLRSVRLCQRCAQLQLHSYLTLMAQLCRTSLISNCAVLHICVCTIALEAELVCFVALHNLCFIRARKKRLK